MYNFLCPTVLIIPKIYILLTKIDLEMSLVCEVLAYFESKIHKDF